MSKYGPSYQTACNIQRRLVQWIMDAKTEADSGAQLARAWTTVEETKRVIRMVPKVQAISIRELQALKAQRQTKQLKAATLFEEAQPTKESLLARDPSRHPRGQGESAPSSSGVGTPPAIDIQNPVDSVVRPSDSQPTPTTSVEAKLKSLPPDLLKQLEEFGICLKPDGEVIETDEAQEPDGD